MTIDLRDRLQSTLGGSYTIERELGGGGMSRVFVAEETALGRQVVVKMLPPEMAAGLSIDRFAREIRLAARLQHPHIVPVLQAGSLDGLPFYTMPLVEGETLRERLRREGPLPIADALHIAREVAGALAYAHVAGVIHRDIKPENVLLSRGHALVTDFGVARAVGEAADGGDGDGGEVLTEVGLAVGTPAYMSPEQITGERTIDGRADVYALGCVLYEMLAGEPPFAGGSLQAVIARRFLEPPPALRRMCPDVPAHIDAAAARAMDRDPAARFATAADFGRALDDESAIAATAPVRAAGPPAVLVLPFANLSPDPDDAFFADGLAEELIADLAKVRALRVISRTTAVRFRGTTKSVPEIAGEVGASHILEGSVRRFRDTLRVTVQLVEATGERHLWAEKYDGRVDEVFELQERLSRTIAGALVGTLTPDEDRRLAARSFDDVRVFECFLRARDELWRFTPDSLPRALAHAQRGLALVPEHPRLLALEGMVHVQHVNMGIGTGTDHLGYAEAVAARLLAEGHWPAEAHTLLGFVRYKQLDMADALRHLAAARRADPAHPNAHFLFGLIAAESGQTEAAQAAIAVHLALDPLSAMSHALAGWVEMVSGRFETAITALRRSVELDSTNPVSTIFFAQALTYAGRRQEACAALTRDLPMFHELAEIYRSALEGDIAYVARGLAPQVADFARHDEQLPGIIAEAYALVGDGDGALEWLGVAIRNGFVNDEFFAVHNPLLAPLRDDPRFVALMAECRRRRGAIAGGPRPT